MENNELLQQQPTFDPKKLEPGAVVRVTSQILGTSRNSYAWNALIMKVEAFEIKVARLPESTRGAYEEGDIQKQTIHIDGVVNGDVKIELLRKP